MNKELSSTYKGKTVFITGHTGFKGSWLALWLKLLGANVIGYSLPPPTSPNHFDLIGLEDEITHIEGDIRNFQALEKAIKTTQPDLIFHLAAQALVLPSYQEPLETFAINSTGAIHLLEAVRKAPSVKGVIVITTDKCYDNKEWVWGYRECDPLGGSDPYSASKAMAELACRSFRDSFFKEGPFLATARAGNVIGGGDFSDFRIVPDTMKALIENRPITLRNPKSIRPWLYVLDPLFGYLLLGKKALSNDLRFAEAWNFGPKETKGILVEEVVKKCFALWGKEAAIESASPSQKQEMGTLGLSWDKAANRLGWSPAASWENALDYTVRWTKGFEQEKGNKNTMKTLSTKLIQEYSHAISTVAA